MTETGCPCVAETSREQNLLYLRSIHHTISLRVCEFTHQCGNRYPETPLWSSAPYGRQCGHNLEIRSFRADGQNCRMPRPQMAFSRAFRSALPQVDRLSPAGYPTPELLQRYRYRSCTFVILTTRATGLRLRRARRGGCPRPSHDAVERSLTSRKSVVSCQ